MGDNVEGHLHVKIIGARNLRDESGNDAKDTYAQVSLEDDSVQTGVECATPNPVWGKDCTFSLSPSGGKVPRLSVQVFTVHQRNDDVLFGVTRLPLDQRLLDLSTFSWKCCRLRLTPSESDSSQLRRRRPLKRDTVRGSVILQVWWEPSDPLPFMQLLRAQWQSASACHVLGCVHLALAGNLLIIAAQARWLAVATAAAAARDVKESVPAASASALVAFFMAYGGAFLQFLGACGALGAWKVGFPGLTVTDKTIAPDDSDEQEQGQDGFKAVMKFSVGGASMFLSGLPSVPVGPLRFLAYIQHAAAALFSSLAMLMAWTQAGDGVRVAEGFYLTLAAHACVIFAVALFIRAAVNQYETSEWAYDTASRDMLLSRSTLLQDDSNRQLPPVEPRTMLADFGPEDTIRVQTHKRSVERRGAHWLQYARCLSGVCGR